MKKLVIALFLFALSVNFTFAHESCRITVPATYNFMRGVVDCIDPGSVNCIISIPIDCGQQ